MIKHFEITVSGRVQAVGFRYYAKQKAQQLGVSGTVQNQVDGTVRIEAEGEASQLQKFINWCNQGPVNASVAKIDSVPGKILGYQSFEIISSSRPNKSS